MYKASKNSCNTYSIVKTESFQLLQSWWSLMKSYIINDSLLYLKEGKILKLQLLTLSVNIFQNIWYATIFTPKGTNKRQKVNIEMLILARHLIWIATDELPLSIQPLYVFPSLNSLCKRCTANNLWVSLLHIHIFQIQKL